MGQFVRSLRALRTAAKSGDEFSQWALVVTVLTSLVVVVCAFALAAVWVWAVTR